MESIHLTKSKVALIYYPIYYSFGNYACIKTFSKYRIRKEIKSKCILSSHGDLDVVSIHYVYYKICILGIHDRLENLII